MRYNTSELFLELEYVGQDLSKFADRKGISLLSKDTAHQIWIDASRGLEYIHTQGILHLDIKPQNILLGQDCRAKICDFGSSVLAVNPVFYDGGTPHYTPPEFVRSGKRGRPADVWGLGLTMHFVLGLGPLPRGRGWKIANIRSGNGDATRRMIEWLNKVRQGAENIPDRFCLLHNMLTIEPDSRITPSELVDNLPPTPQTNILTNEICL